MKPQRPYAVPFPEISTWHLLTDGGISKPGTLFAFTSAEQVNRVPQPVAFEAPYTSPETGERWLMRFVRLDIAQGAPDDAVNQSKRYVLTGVRPAPMQMPPPEVAASLSARLRRWLLQRLA